MVNESSAAKHVLVVEDEPDFAALIRSILVRAGYTVTTAHRCDDALSIVRQLRPDLITLDLQMPGESGALLYRKLKADERFRDIPVVVVTGLTRHDKDMENLVKSLLEPEHVPHPEAYVEKPFDGPHFLATIEETLSSSTCASR